MTIVWHNFSSPCNETPCNCIYYYMLKRIGILLCVSAFALAACSKDLNYESMDLAPRSSASAHEGSQESGGGVAGKVTAGEWNDLDNWFFWGPLMNGEKENQMQTEYTRMPDYWRFYTNRRVAVRVADANGTPQNDVVVELTSDGKTIWKCRTDNLGRAEAWIGLFDSRATSGDLAVSLNGVKQEGAPAVTTWKSAYVENNDYVFSAKAPEAVADILFIVDATGSMSDEIDFLKADLLDILQKVRELKTGTEIRTASLFYRDVGDEYLTVHSPFTPDSSSTIEFISGQSADGGGDYPEAVHTALEQSLKELDWKQSASTRIAFMLLDAPPHQDHQGVIQSLQKSISAYAERGIKLIPVASSGVDKATEFLLRFFAISTNGTYVFLTDTSGIGDSHLPATVGEFKEEYLNELIVRLITKYI